MASILRTRKVPDISHNKSSQIQQLSSKTKVKRKYKVSDEIKQGYLEQKRTAEKSRREKIRRNQRITKITVKVREQVMKKEKKRRKT
ncbi:hypothetical protein HHI36_022116 [Cryptolaemus montrouzieri]|uniref:Uncharacterized protein n=1 Tax=Cryptolaemus montrouzieri TaxID=559131 RepID=A0ABD2MZJ9_9CUCU